jgi:hypothetical protein
MFKIYNLFSIYDLKKAWIYVTIELILINKKNINVIHVFWLVNGSGNQWKESWPHMCNVYFVILPTKEYIYTHTHLGFASLHNFTDNLLIDWWKKSNDCVEIKFHPSEILNEIACNLNWIGVQFNFKILSQIHWMEFKFNLIWIQFNSIPILSNSIQQLD